MREDSENMESRLRIINNRVEEINIEKSVYDAYIDKIKGRLFGLLKEKEKGGEWEKFLDNILIELMGFPEEKHTINFLRLVNKLSACRYLRYEYFRKTIFECMNLFDTWGG